jgi:hypothetical protein
MPISSIITQPSSNSINAAYRPIVFVVRATETDSTPIPPVVYCDIYINSVFYKTLSKNQYYSLASGASDWLFDIQDACQEMLKSNISPNGESSIVLDLGPLINVQCKFRSSGIDTNGFVLAEDTAPIQGTGSVDPTSGTGTASNSIIVINSTLQHNQNQNLLTHLNSYKTGTWNASTFPLTHRTDNYRVCKRSSDYFPILSAFVPDCIRIHYKVKGSSTYTTESNCGGGGGCNAVSYSGVAPNLPNGTVGVPYSFSFTVLGDAPISISGITNRPIWMNISVSGNIISLTGTPTTAGTNIPVTFNIVNCGGSIPFNKTFNVSAACVHVSLLGAAALPDAIVGQPYDVTVAVLGTAPIVTTGAITKPTWMSIVITGNNIRFTGTPTSIATGQPVSFTLSNCAGTGTVLWSTTINVTPATADLTISFNRFSSSFTVGLSHSLDASFNITLLFADGFSTSPCTGSAVASAQFNAVSSPWVISAGWTGDSKAPDSTSGTWASANFSTVYNLVLNGSSHIDGDVITIGSYTVTLHLQNCA